MVLIIVYVTNKNKKEARKLVMHLLKKKLIACANIFPIESIYHWNGKVENTKEVVTILKTRKDNWKILKAEIEKVHPYEVPCIIKIPVVANSLYEKWILNETTVK